MNFNLKFKSNNYYNNQIPSPATNDTIASAPFVFAINSSFPFASMWLTFSDFNKSACFSACPGLKNNINVSDI